MNSTTRQELLQLVSLLHDGCLTEDGFRKLEDLVRRDPECCELYLRLSDLHAKLTQKYRRSTMFRDGDSIESDFALTADTARHAHRSVRAWSLKRSGLAVALSASVVIAYFFFVHSRQPVAEPELSGPLFPAVLGSVTDLVGQVSIAGKPAAADADLINGADVRTGADMSSVGLKFTDGTVVHFGEDSAATLRQIDGQKSISLEQGVATANVQPQPESKPLIVYTPTAILEVVGTKFVFSASSEATELGVREGVVLMKPRRGGKPVRVAGDEYAEANRSGVLPPMPTGSPEFWSEDFKNGLPDNWIQGEWLRGGFGEDFEGAIAATSVRRRSDARLEAGLRRPQEAHFAIRSDCRWANGLVRIQEETCLTYRIKMDLPRWHQVFLCVHTSDGSLNYNYEFVHGKRWRATELGSWKTITLPLSSFRRTREPQKGASPPIDGTIVWIMFTTQELDCGMAIDDIRIGPDTKALRSDSQ